MAGVLVSPGGEVELQLTLDVSQLAPGPLQKSVWLVAAGSSIPALTLEIAATTEAAVQFAPAGLEFGRVRDGIGGSRPFSVSIDRRLLKLGTPPALRCTLLFVKIEPFPTGDALRDGIKPALHAAVCED